MASVSSGTSVAFAFSTTVCARECVIGGHESLLRCDRATWNKNLLEGLSRPVANTEQIVGHRLSFGRCVRCQGSSKTLPPLGGGVPPPRGWLLNRKSRPLSANGKALQQGR